MRADGRPGAQWFFFGTEAVDCLVGWSESLQGHMANLPRYVDPGFSLSSFLDFGCELLALSSKGYLQVFPTC